jgi:hypothetical protein
MMSRYDSTPIILLSTGTTLPSGVAQPLDINLMSTLSGNHGHLRKMSMIYFFLYISKAYVPLLMTSPLTRLSPDNQRLRAQDLCSSLNSMTRRQNGPDCPSNLRITVCTRSRGYQIASQSLQAHQFKLTRRALRGRRRRDAQNERGLLRH